MNPFVQAALTTGGIVLGVGVALCLVRVWTAILNAFPRTTIVLSSVLIVYLIVLLYGMV